MRLGQDQTFLNEIAQNRIGNNDHIGSLTSLKPIRDGTLTGPDGGRKGDKIFSGKNFQLWHKVKIGGRKGA